MKKCPCHYCKICGRRRANEKFSGSGHAAHICKDCARLPIEKRNELQTLTRIENLPFRLNREQRSWLEKKCKDKRGTVRDTAKWAYEMRFPKRQQDEQGEQEASAPKEKLEIIVRLSDITDAVEMTFCDIEYYLDKKTGEIICSDGIMFDEEFADQVEEHGFFILPRTFGIYRTMVKFVRTLPDELHDELNAALKEKDATGRFVAAVRQLGIEKQWLTFKKAAYMQKVIKWCEDNGIGYE